MVERPASLVAAVRAAWALVALGLVTVALTVLLRDQLIRAWAQGRPDERRLLAIGGLDAVKSGTVPPPAFVPVALVLFVTLAGLIWVLVSFLRRGYGWARLALTVLTVFLAVGAVSSLRTGPPAVFVVLCVLSFPIEIALLVGLWRHDTGAFLRGEAPVVAASTPEA